MKNRLNLQKKYWSDKKSKHTQKAQVFISKHKSKTGKHRILTTNFGKGRTHDFDIFKTNQRTLSALNRCQKLGDKAYISKKYKDSHQIQTPHKRPRSKNKTKSKPQPKKTKLTKEQKTFNKAFSKIRIGIEHTFAHFKKFQILSKPYRNRRKRFGLRFNLIAGIYNFEIDM